MLTSVDDIVLMAVVQSAAYLPGELTCHPFPQPTMADDIVKHLATIHVLEHHIIVMLVDDHLSHTADIWVM